MVLFQLATAFGEADVAPVGGAIGRAGKTERWIGLIKLN